MIPLHATWVRFPRFVGDAVMHFPMLRLLRDVSDDPIVVWGPKLTVNLLAGTDLADALCPDEIKRMSPWQMADLLKRHQAKRSVHFPKSLRPALGAFWARVPERIGVSESLAGFLNTHTLPFWKGEGTCLARYWKVLRLRWPDCPDPSFVPFRSPFKAQLPDQPYICLMPGASNPAKTWPAASFARLGELARQGGYLPVVLGGPNERDLGESVAGASGINRCGDTLQEAAAWMAGAALCVGNDSGLGHLSAACGAPTLVMAGPMEPEMFRPFGPHVDLMAVEGLACAPCGRKTCPLPDHPCLERISPETVWSRSLSLMQKSRNDL